MKHKIYLILLLTAVCFLSSCSWVTSFVVINASDQPLEVKYTLAPLSGIDAPEKTTVDEKRNLKNDGWQKLAPEQFAVDYETETITVTLAPNEALKVASETTYLGHDLEKGESSKIKGLSLTGAKGAAKYEGRQALTQFRKESDSLYTIIYE